MSGRLIGVVGPSGVGKDTLMTAIAKACPQIGIVQRVITRAPGLGGEDYLPVTEAEFSRMVGQGAFCIHWRAHGLCYGIPASTRARLAEGADLLVNLSRGVLAQVDAAFPSFLVLHVTAAQSVLAARLAARGRETPDAITARLLKADKPLPSGVDVVTVHNDGDLSDSVGQAMTALYPVRA